MHSQGLLDPFFQKTVTPAQKNITSSAYTYKGAHRAT